MAGTTTRNDAESSMSSDAVGIPTDLNRIKTRIPLNNNDNIHISSNSVHTKSLKSWFKQKHQRSFGRGFVKLHSSREGEACCSLLVGFLFQQFVEVKKQTAFFLQTAEVWSTSSATDVCRCGPQTADVLPLKKQTAP
ncbi:hypothetical protein HanXRQr2_Chr07g0304971 [Helianthus annuus]|uniref:Uncharacterized protein n=1 Tax=Helianthus annuus TaxID=4232 RepID=A0A9K3IM38_HELAN|nr:hypothetical protein HanXRQr2_Chr07g0304971 [Helianthus annuus]